VRPEFRGLEIGRILTEQIINEASEIGYSRMRLDTIAGKMDRAITMYRELGFAETDPYYQTPVAQTLFMELALTAATGESISSQQEVSREQTKKNRSSLKAAFTHVINSAVCGRANHDP
jgi:Acetyltransferase (GNAT) family